MTMPIEQTERASHASHASHASATTLALALAEIIPPDSKEMNQRRAESAADTLDYFAREHGEHYQTATVGEARALAEQNLSDLLCNFAHFCDRLGLQLDEVLRRAAGYYVGETTDDEGVRRGEQIFCGEATGECSRPQIVPDDGTEPHAADCPSRHCGECLCGVADRAGGADAINRAIEVWGAGSAGEIAGCEVAQ